MSSFVVSREVPRRGLIGVVYSLLLALALLASPAAAAEFAATTLGDFGNVSVMEVTGDFGGDLIEPRQIVAKEFFRTHKDEYDFLVFFANFDYSLGSIEQPNARVNGFYRGVKNDIGGIGQALFDYTSFYGSAGRLQGTVDMGNLARQVTNPLDSNYDTTMMTLVHELLHRWGAYVSFRDESGTVSNALIGQEGSHWSYLLDSQGSVQYGSRWRDNGDGTFTALETRTYYSPLDLYLMGMIGKDAVPPMLLIDNPGIDPTKLPEPGVTITGAARTVTIDDIIAAEGPRTPSAEQAQKSFKTAFIYLTTPGTLDRAELTKLETVRNGFLTRFSILTDGEALVQVAAAPREVLPNNPGVESPLKETRSVPPSIEEGVAWLKGRQQADGAWRDSQQTAVRDTAEAASALDLFAGNETEVELAAGWLATATEVSTDYLARKVESLARAGKDTSVFVQELLARQNRDGGWGSGSDFASNPTDTALALKALAETGFAGKSVLDPAVDFLKTRQNADGGWSGEGTTSLIQATANALLAFNAYAELYDSAEAGAKAVAFLQSRQNVDGGFGNSPSTVYDSAAAVLALAASGAGSAKEPASRGVEYMLAEQSADGSWYGSPYQTAMAVQAVQAATIEPDLAISVEGLTFIPEKIAKLPTNAVISAEIENLGRTDVAQAAVALYEGEVRPENLVDSQTLAFPAQSATVVTFAVAIEDAGERVFTVIVDPDNAVKEAGEGNNRAAKVFSAQATYDLDVAEAGLKLSADTVEAFQELTLSTTVRNLGTVAVYDVPVSFYVDAAGQRIDVATRKFDIPAGGTQEVATVWRATHPGTDLKAVVEVDPGDSYAEIDEENNRAFALLTVNGSTRPNLSLSYDQISFEPDPVGEQKPATISAVVTNNGFAAVAAVPVHFYQGVPGFGGELLATTVIEALSAGAKVTVQGVWEQVPEAGEQIVTVVVDPDDAVDEIVEDDNEAFTTVQSLTLPDLVLSPSSVAISPAVPREGDLLTLTVTVQNAGEQAVNAVALRVQNNEELACQAMVPTIAGNSQATISIDCGAAAEAGLYGLKVMVDPDDQIAEQREDNNTAEKKLPVQNASLWVSEKYISPNGDGVQDQTQFGFRLDATATVTVVVRNEAGTAVRTYRSGELEQTLGTQIVWDGLSDAGTVVDDGIYAIEMRSADESVLGSAQVVVDNNRNSLVDALIEGAMSQRSADLPPGVGFVGLLPDESGALYSKQASYSCENAAGEPYGLYFVPRFTMEPELITPAEWLGGGYECSNMRVGLPEAGGSIAVLQLGYNSGTQQRDRLRLWGYDDRSGVWQVFDEIPAPSGVSFSEYGPAPALAPDGRHIAFLSGLLNPDGSAVYTLNLVDVATKIKTTLDQFVGSPWMSGALKWNATGDLLVYQRGTELWAANVTGEKWQIKSFIFDNVNVEWLGDRWVVLGEGGRSSAYGVIDVYSPATPAVSFSGSKAFVSPDRTKCTIIDVGGTIHYLWIEGGEVNKSGYFLGMFLPPEEFNDILQALQIMIYRGSFGINKHAGYWDENGNFNYLFRTFSGKTYITNIDSQKKYIKFNSVNISLNVDPYYFSYLNQTFSKTANYLIYGDYSNSIEVVDLGSGEHWSRPLDGFTGLQNGYLSEESQSIIANGYSSDHYVLNIWESLQNLTAQLLALNRQSDILLMGTATDLNFADYRLEYADLQNPEVWNLIRPPSDSEVVNDIFTAWIPSHRGTYYVRLSVRDKAGNVRSAVRQVIWAPASPPDIANLYAEPQLFSPNGDGVLDQVELHYMALQPVHLVFTVVNEAGNKVRTLTRDHALPGDYALAWDGRNEDGLTVPDGLYRVRVYDHEFSVVIDNTPPAVSLSLSAIGVSEELIKAELSGYALDESLKEWRLEYGDGTNPAHWEPYAEGQGSLVGLDPQSNAPLLDPPGEKRLKEFRDQAVAWLGGKRFRLVATDRAGNSTSRMVGPAEDEFVLYGWDSTRSLELLPGDRLRSGTHSAIGLETLDFELRNLTLQYYVGGKWVDAAGLIDYSSGLIKAQPLVTAETGAINAVRLKGDDAAGQQYYSNVLRTREAFSLGRECGTEYVTGKNHLSDDLATLRLEYLDPATSKWTSYHAWSNADEKLVPYGEFEIPLPYDVWQRGQKPSIRMVGLSVSGKVYQSTSILWPTDGPDSGCLEIPTVSVSPTSSQVELKVSYPEAQCGQLSGQAAIFARMNVSGTKPQYIELFLNEGGETRKIGQLISGAGSQIDLNTSTLPEGSHPLTAVYHYLDADGLEQSFSRESRLLVDRALPQSLIIYPAQGSFLCPMELTDGDVTWFGIPIDAVISDNIGGADYTLYYGEGDNPGTWRVATTRKGGKSAAITGRFQGHGAIGIWDTGSLKGRYTLKLKVVDAAGNVSCHTVGVDVNSGVAITKLTPVPLPGVDPKEARSIPLFSPTASGVENEVKVEYRIDRPASVDVEVYRLQRNNEGRLALDGLPPVRTLASSVTYLAGSNFVAWNGRDDTGNAVVDGYYAVAVRATNSCGDQAQRWFAVEVDGTPPEAIVSYPGTNDSLGTIVEVRGTVNDAHFGAYWLQAGEGEAPESWLEVSAGKAPVAQGVLGSWNTYQLEGVWSLRLSAEDEAGNRSSTQVTVDLGQRQDLVQSLTLEPRIFSPNQDGIDDHVVVTYVLTAACEVQFEFVDAQGQVIRTVSATTNAAGAFQLLWQGENQEGVLAGDGPYQVRLSVTKSDDPMLKQTEFVTVDIDTTGPVIDLTEPVANAYLNLEHLSVIGSISDRNLANYELVLAGPDGNVGIDKGFQERTSYPFGSINDLPEGAYTITATAEDQVGNRSKLERAFTLDRTAPEVTLQFDGEGKYFGNERTSVEMSGAVVEEHPERYILRYGLGDDPTEWHVLVEKEGVPGGEPLFSWPVGAEGGVADGNYTLSLHALDKAGLENEARLSVVVDNTAPEALFSAEANRFVSAGTVLEGTAFDTNFSQWHLELAKGDCEGEHLSWGDLKTASTPVVNGPLMTWSNMAADGGYCLRLSVDDQVGHRQETVLTVRQDTVPPKAPVLGGQIEEGTGVRLQWQGNGETDLAGYFLYRNGQKLNTQPLAAQDYFDSSLAEGMYIYTLSAIDLAGNVSPLSEPFVATIDLTGPSARLSAPRPDALVSGLVSIQGTAFSSNDFKDYRVSVGAGVEPSTWTLLRTSPLPTASAGHLADWNSLGVQEGPYTIKLEAEDLSGNVTVRTVLVTLDNTPPQAPVLTSAEASGADVTVSWEANSESDLAGYLLFRNDRLVNAGTGLLTDFKKYLLTERTHVDSGAPDGEQSYYVLAMDVAGNLSAASNTLKVTLDTHAPQAIIVNPENHSSFEGPIVLRADCADSDLASLQFQYLSSLGTWIDINAPGTEVSFTASFDPRAVELGFGAYQFRVVATDLAGQADPTPAFISLNYTDETAPAAPAGVKAAVNGRLTVLSWEANTEDDLAGYNVYRTQGTNKVKLNSAVLTQAGYQDVELPDGEYSYEITAVDNIFGNESDGSKEALARIYAPTLTPLTSTVSGAAIEVTGEGAAPLATVAVTVVSSSGETTTYSTVADEQGHFGFEDVSLTIGENKLRAKATDTAGNVSRESDPVAIVYDLPPQAPGALTATVEGSLVQLNWEPALNPDSDLAGYRVYRAEGEGDNWQVLQLELVTATTFSDSGLANGVYRYRVVAVDQAGAESLPSPEAAVEVAGELPTAPQIIEVSSSSEGATLVVTWVPTDSGVASYHLYRGANSGGPYLRVGVVPADETAYADTDLTDGWAYYYVVTAVDALGNESAYSNEAFGIPLDIVAPSVPVLSFPTTSDHPIIVTANRVSLAGMAEPGVDVELYHDGLWLSKVRTSILLDFGTEGIDYSGTKAVLSPDGRQLARIDFSGALRLESLSTGTSIVVAVDVSDVTWSPDGKKLVYRYSSTNALPPIPPFFPPGEMPPPGSAPEKLKLYDLDSGTGQDLTLDFSANEKSPSWSADSTKVAFISDRTGMPTVWIKDLVTGSLTQTSSGYATVAQLSPDGQNVAFFQSGPALVLADVNGGVQVVDTQTDGSSLAWSNDGRRLAFVSYRSGASELFSLDLDSGVQARISGIPGEKSLPSWNSDSGSIVFAAVDGDVRSVWTAQTDGTEALLTNHVTEIVDLDWRASGEIVLTDPSKLIMAYPAGFFRLDNVSLEPGENLFYAVAEDGAGNRSSVSEAISVIAETVQLPDIALTEDGLSIYPLFPHPQEEITVRWTIANPSEMALDDVPVEISLWGADGELILLESTVISRLEPHSSEELSLTHLLGNQEGSSTIIAVVDPADQIAELVESNNSISKEFFVSRQGGAKLITRLNASQFGSNQDVAIEIALSNSGDPIDITLDVGIADAGGTILESFTPYSGSLPYGPAKSFSSRWNTGSTFAGNYQVHVAVRDASGSVVDEESIPFTILPDRKVDGVVSTAKGSYGARETVRAEISLRNAGVNSILSDVKVHTVIVDAQNQELFASDRTLASLWPGMQSSLSESWSTGLVTPGEYRIVSEIHVGEDLVKSATATFQVKPDIRLAGELSLASSIALYGNGFTARFVAQNDGNTATAGALVCTLIDPQTLSVLETKVQDVSLVQGVPQSGEFVFSTENLALKSYQLRLQFVGSGADKVLGQASVSVRDGIAPQIVVASPEQGAVFESSVLLAAIVTDDASGVERVEYRIDDREWLALPFTDRATGRFTTKWEPSLLDDGEHSVRFRAFDLAGNRIESSPVAFEIQMRDLDQQAPVTTIVTGVPKHTDSDGNFYVSASTFFSLAATDDASGVARSEYRVDAGSWVVYTGALSLSGLADGEHRIGFRSIDNANNVEEEQVLTVLVDNTAPVTGSSIGDPQFSGDLLYVTGVTEFTLAAEDSLSGAARTEYRIDGGDWVAYEPFTLYDLPDGEHTISYRSIDNVTNVENEHVLTVVIDNTSPDTSIGFQNQSYMDGDRLLVSGQTLVSLTAVDALSGVASSQYRLDDEEGWRSYYGAFQMSGLEFGAHIIHFRSVDNVWNEESEQAVEVVLFGVEVATEVLNLPRVLVWSEDPDTINGKDKPDYTLEDLQSLVKEALGEPDVYLTLVTDKEDFRAAFRSGIYNMAFIINQDMSFDTVFLRELREAVHRGVGLLVSTWGNNVHPLLQDVFGVDFKGSLAMDAAERTLYLYQSPVSAEQTLAASGRVLRTTLDGGTLGGVVLGESTCDGLRVLTLHYPAAVHPGDRVTVTLATAQGKKSVTVDEEQLAVADLPAAEVNSTTTNPAGDLAIVSATADGVTLSLAAPYGYLEASYTLTLTIEGADGSLVTTGAVVITPDCGANLRAGVNLGPFQVRGVDEDRVKSGDDLPAVVLGRYGEGRTAFLSYNLIESALSGQRAEHLSLLRKAATYLLPEEATPEAGGVALLETRLKLQGRDLDLQATDTLGEGLTHLPLFDLTQSPLTYGFHLAEGEEAAWRYFVRLDDRSGDFARTTDVSLGLDGDYVPLSSTVATLQAAVESRALLQRALAWVEAQAAVHPEATDALGTLREALLQIASLPQESAAETESIIHLTVQTLHQALQLGFDVAELRSVLDDYLRIVEGKGYFAE